MDGQGHHQPLPAIDASCAAFMVLARSRANNAAELTALADEVERLRTSTVAARVQQWLVERHSQQRHSQRQRCLEGDRTTRRCTSDDDEEDEPGNVYTRTFFSRLHLANRDPLPFGENYSVVLQPLACGAEATMTTPALAQAACVTRAALVFWSGLAQSSEAERRRFLRDVEGAGADQPLPECSQYGALFGSARLPAEGIDIEHTTFTTTTSSSTATASQLSTGLCFVVACRGQFFAVSLPQGRDASTITTRALEAALADIVRQATGTARPCGDADRLVGLLTCMERDEAAVWRGRALQPDSERAFSMLRDALFVLCLDDATDQEQPHGATESSPSTPTVDAQADGVYVRGGELKRRRRMRTVFNGLPGLERGECSRWFEKGLQILVTGDLESRQTTDHGSVRRDDDVAIGINVEHSFADSGVVHKLCSFLWKEAQSCYANAVAPLDAGESLEWQRLDWGRLDAALREKLGDVQAALVERDRALDSTTVDCTVHGVSRQFFKDHHWSPDACFQIALHIACCVHEAKYVWNLETLDARHFVDGRLIIADVFTPEFRELQAALFTALGMTPAPRDSDRQAEAESATDSDTRLRDALARCGEDTELVTLFRRAVDAHLRVLAQHKAGMESYLHLCLLANEMNTVKEHPPHALTDNPTYCATYRNYIVGSNLGNDIGIEFVFSGIPPAQSMDVLGYMLADDHIKLTLTSRSPIRPSFLATLVAALALVQRWTAQTSSTDA